MRTTSIVQSRSFSLFAAFATLLWSIPGNVDAGQGIALLKSRQDQLEEYWTALPFQSRETYAVVDNFRVAGKVNPVAIPKSEIGKVFDLPDLTGGSFLGDSDIAAVVAKRKELQDGAKRFKAAAPELLAAARTLEVAEQQFAAGKVMRNGKWISSDEWKKAQKVENTQAATIATITVNGKTYKDVRLTSFRGETTGIIHAEGIGTFLTSALSDQQIAQLNATSQTVKIDKSKPIVVAVPLPPQAPPTPLNPPEETPKVIKGTTSADNEPNATGEFLGGPTTETVRAGVAKFSRMYLLGDFSKGKFRRGEPLESRGNTLMPAGTILYPVKFETQKIEMVFYLFQDGFGDWQCTDAKFNRAFHCKK